MPEIARALTTLSLDAAALERVRRAIAPGVLMPVNRFNPLAVGSAVSDADVAFLLGDLDDRILAGRILRWVHCGHGGVERSARPEVFARGLLLTSAAGRSAPALAEHVMFFMLALGFDYPRFHEAQRAHRWGVRGQRTLRALHGATVALIGLGHIGVEVARRARAFGMRVVALRRRDRPCAEVDHLYCTDNGDGLEAVLGEGDFVVLALPLTDRTRRLIGDEELSGMKPSAYLINIGRGGLIDEPALIRALEEGRIAGAAIDSVETEPLPASSPLWRAPNLIITPHVTPRLADREARQLDILCENIRRYRAGEPLLNQVTAEDVYTPAEGVEAGRSPSTGAFRRGHALARRVAHRWRTR